MKASIRTDTKLWVFEETDQPTAVGLGPAKNGERVYVFGYTWFEARTGALAALQRSSGLVQGREIQNIKDHLVEAGSTIVYVDRGSSWFEIIETLRRMSGEEARKLLAYPTPFESDPEKRTICKNQFTDHLDGGRFYVCELLAGHGGEQHTCGDVGWPVEPEPEPEAMLEALPSSAPAHPSSAELRDRLIADAEHNADWPEMARIASQAIDALEAIEIRLGNSLGSRQQDLKDMPLCAGCAAVWFTERNTLGQPDEPCIACAFSLTASATIDRLMIQKEAAYDERNRLVALFASMALALGWKAGVGQHEDEPGKEWDADWRTLIMVETPEGQASWHLHDSQNHLVKHLPSYVAKWDGHDTPTKYARLEKLSQARIVAAPWEAVAKECVVWSVRRAKEAEGHHFHDSWVRLRTEAEAFAELGAYFRGLARGSTRDWQEFVNSPPTQEIRVWVEQKRLTWAVKLGVFPVASFADEQEAVELQTKLTNALTKLGASPAQGQDMTRNPTVEEELARVRSELNHYREKYLNDDRIPLANTEILRLQSEVAALRTSIQFCSGSCRLPEDTAPMVDGVRLPSLEHHDPAKGTGYDYAEDVRECVDSAVAEERVKLEEMTKQRDEWRQDSRLWLAKLDLVRPVVNAAVAHVEADTTSEINATIEVLGDAVRTYQSARTAGGDQNAVSEATVEVAVLKERDACAKACLDLQMPLLRNREALAANAACVRAIHDRTAPTSAASIGLPTPERRGQEIAHLEEKYAINAAIARRSEPGRCGEISSEELGGYRCTAREGHNGDHWHSVDGGTAAWPNAALVRHETVAIREIGGCGAIAGQKPRERACILPMGHLGPHGWEESAESSVVVRLEAAQGGFRAVVASPHDAGFVMISAIDIEDDAQFYVDSANKALVPFLRAEYRRGLLKAAEECRVVAAEMDRRTSVSRNVANKEADARYRAKRDAASECQMLIEALAKAAT